MKKVVVIIACLANGCSLMAPKPSNAIEELGERVISKKEGIDIRLTPIEEIKEPQVYK